MKKIQLITISAIILISCASPGTLGGGPEDTTPPVLLHSNLSETNFTENKIVLEFDEYIQLDNPFNNLKLMPMHSKITAKVLKKKVIIDFDTTLHPNTTYSIVSENCIKDVNAGNFYNFTEIFSTGSNIDTNYIDVNLNYLKTEKNLFLALLEKNSSDSLRNFKSDYIYPVKKKNYRFSGLKDKTYHLWLYTDANADGKPDWYSPINFITQTKTDTIYNLKTLNWKQPFKINKSLTDLKYTKLFYNSSEFYFDELKKLFPNDEENLIYCNEDSAVFENFSYEFEKDTIEKIDIENEMKSMIENSMEVIKNKTDKICLFRAPQAIQNSVSYAPTEKTEKRLKLEQDSFFVNVPQLNKNLLIRINPSKFKESKKLSYLNIIINSKKYSKIDIHIISNNETKFIIYESNGEDFYLEPGDYKIEIYESSLNHTFNPFETKNRSALIYEKSLNLRASWEEILNVNLD